MKKIAYAALLAAFILLCLTGCADNYDVGYQVVDTRKYVVGSQNCMGYYVTIDMDTFDLSQGQKEFNKQIKYVYEQVIKDDGYYQHTVWIYADATQIGEMEFTVAMVDEGHEWKSGWMITPNEDFYNEHFGGFGSTS